MDACMLRMQVFNCCLSFSLIYHGNGYLAMSTLLVNTSPFLQNYMERVSWAWKVLWTWHGIYWYLCLRLGPMIILDQPAKSFSTYSHDRTLVWFEKIFLYATTAQWRDKLSQLRAKRNFTWHVQCYASPSFFFLSCYHLGRVARPWAKVVSSPLSSSTLGEAVHKGQFFEAHEDAIRHVHHSCTLI